MEEECLATVFFRGLHRLAKVRADRIFAFILIFNKKHNDLYGLISAMPR